MSLYDELVELGVQLGFADGLTMTRETFERCETQVQRHMVAQFKVKVDHLSRYEAQHGEVW